MAYLIHLDRWIRKSHIFVSFIAKMNVVVKILLLGMFFYVIFLEKKVLELCYNDGLGLHAQFACNCYR